MLLLGLYLDLEHIFRPVWLAAEETYALGRELISYTGRGHDPDNKYVVWVYLTLGSGYTLQPGLQCLLEDEVYHWFSTDQIPMELLTCLLWYVGPGECAILTTEGRPFVVNTATTCA